MVCQLSEHNVCGEVVLNFDEIVYYIFRKQIVFYSNDVKYVYSIHFHDHYYIDIWAKNTSIVYNIVFVCLHSQQNYHF